MRIVCFSSCIYLLLQKYMYWVFMCRFTYWFDQKKISTRRISLFDFPHRTFFLIRKLLLCRFKVCSKYMKTEQIFRPRYARFGPCTCMDICIISKHVNYIVISRAGTNIDSLALRHFVTLATCVLFVIVTCMHWTTRNIYYVNKW